MKTLLIFNSLTTFRNLNLRFGKLLKNFLKLKKNDEEEEHLNIDE